MAYTAATRCSSARWLRPRTWPAASAGLLTFDPHPVAVLRPDLALPYLTSPEERADLLAALGLDFVLILPFDRATAALERRRIHAANRGPCAAVRAVDRPRLRPGPRARGERGTAGRARAGTGLRCAGDARLRLARRAGAQQPHPVAAGGRWRGRAGRRTAGAALHGVGRGGPRRGTRPHPGLPDGEPQAARGTAGARLRHLCLLGLARGDRLPGRGQRGRAPQLRQRSPVGRGVSAGLRRRPVRGNARPELHPPAARRAALPRHPRAGQPDGPGRGGYPSGPGRSAR